MNLKINNISFTYNNKFRKNVFNNISFDVNSDEIIAIMGKSGVGKTTLARLLSGLLKPNKGNIMLDEKIVNGASSNIVVSFQENTYFPWLTVFNNAIFGLEKNKSNILLINELLKSVGLYEYKNYYPDNLSGGMRQRLGIIRSIAVNPKFIILDEPFSALDVIVKRELIKFIKEKKEEFGFGIICILHSIEDAVELADRIIVIKENIENNIALDIRINSKSDFILIKNKIIKSLEN